jgi:hypothetical protein
VLIRARQAGERLAVACSTCYNVLRRTNRVIREDEDSREKLNFFLEADYSGDLEVLDLLQILRDDIGFDKIKEAVKKPLSGLKVAAYYGCMVLRPPDEVAYDDPENPRALDDLMTALGADSGDEFYHPGLGPAGRGGAGGNQLPPLPVQPGQDAEGDEQPARRFPAYPYSVFHSAFGNRPGSG